MSPGTTRGRVAVRRGVRDNPDKVGWLRRLLRILRRKVGAAPFTPIPGSRVGGQSYLTPESGTMEGRLAVHPDTLLSELLANARRGLGGPTESIPPLWVARSSVRLLQLGGPRLDSHGRMPDRSARASGDRHWTRRAQLGSREPIEIGQDRSPPISPRGTVARLDRNPTNLTPKSWGCSSASAVGKSLPSD